MGSGRSEASGPSARLSGAVDADRTLRPNVILPFAVVADLGWATPIGSGLVGLMFLLAVQIGDQLAQPFAGNIVDVPMTAISRTIEIDLDQMIGRLAPQPVTPVAEVLY